MKTPHDSKRSLGRFRFFRNEVILLALVLRCGDYFRLLLSHLCLCLQPIV